MPTDEKTFAFDVGQPVEKFTGEARWSGVVVSRYHTTRGGERYVVEVKPQGFQMIAVPSQLRAALEAAEAGAVPAADEPRPKHLCQMIRDGLAAGACLAIAEPDEDGFLVRSLILPADEVEEMLRLAEGTGVTQALADLRRQLHHAQAELMLSASPPSEASREERAAIRKEAFEEAAQIARIEAEQCASLGCSHPENSQNRDRLFARARSAEAIATAIRARGEA